MSFIRRFALASVGAGYVVVKDAGSVAAALLSLWNGGAAN